MPAVDPPAQPLTPTPMKPPEPFAASRVPEVSENDKLHLVIQVASEVAAAFRLEDPAELWGAGWEALSAAVAGWDGRRPLLPFARTWILRQLQREAAFPRGRRKSVLTGSKNV
jgi:hypothetical protein